MEKSTNRINKKQPSVNIKLFEKGKEVYNHTFLTTTRPIRSLQIRVNKSGYVFDGECTVTYKPGYWNKFTFNSYKTFKQAYQPCVEKQLLEFIYA